MTQPRPTLQDLARAIADVNEANGWTEDFNRKMIPERIALIHSEVSEASRERSRAKRARELGDAKIRALHLCELIAPDVIGQLVWQPCLTERRPALPVRIWMRLTRPQQDLRLHALLSAALEVYRKATDYQVNMLLIHQLLDLIERINTLLLCELPASTTPTALILDINGVNATRGRRHGNLRC